MRLPRPGFSGGSGRPVQAQAQNLGPGVITSVTTDTTTGGHFTDQYGSPRLWVATETWGLPGNAGRWNGSGGSTANGDYDNFLSQRAAQGFTVMMTDPVWADTSAGAASASGNTWDGLTPLTGGTANPTGATLNSSFWARIDHMFTSAAAQGITIGLTACNVGDDLKTGQWQNSWTNTQWQDWGTLIGTRYKNTPNLIWLVGNDMFSPFSDGPAGSVYTGITGTGDTHLWSFWYNAECTSRYITDTAATEDLGVSDAAFNFGYSYNASYWIIEYMYQEVTAEGAATLLPPIWGDGLFYTGSSGGTYFAADDRGLRQQWWWALASGSRGVLGEAENVYPWSASSCPGAVTGDWFFANNAANAVSLYTGLPGWYQLVPDTTNTLVTAGRGTRVSGLASGGGATAYSGFGNSYVAASRTPDTGSGSHLAVLYLPNATTITVHAGSGGMLSGYGGTWHDPITGTASSAGSGPTFNSTAKGSNSQGDPDWVLVLQG